MDQDHPIELHPSPNWTTSGKGGFGTGDLGGWGTHKEKGGLSYFLLPGNTPLFPAISTILHPLV